MVNDQPPDVGAHVCAEKGLDCDRLLSAVESFGREPDRAALLQRVAAAIRDVLGCDEAAVIEEVGHGEVVAGPLRAALLAHARRSGRPTAVSADDLAVDRGRGAALADTAALAETWAVAPLTNGHASESRAVVAAAWRSRRDPRQRELRALGVVARWAAAAIELTDRRAAMDASLQASDEFVSAAAHELRTPLTPLRLTIDRAARALGTYGDADRAKGALASVDEHVRRMTSLVDTLLEASRVARGDLVLVWRDTDLGALIGEVAARHAQPAQHSGCALTVEAPERVVGRLDAQRVKEALAQLVGNAIKFGCGCPVRIALTRDGGSARILVRDEGAGIGAADHERIFERFARAVSVRNFGGLGVGLWLAREIARAHGGDLTVESAPGAGASFTLELPLAGRVSAAGPGGARS